MNQSRTARRIHGPDCETTTEPCSMLLSLLVMITRFPRHSIWGERCIEHIYVALPVSAAFCRISNPWAFSHKDAHIKDNVTGADRTGRAHRFISCAGEDGAAAGWLVDPTQKRRAREHFSRTCGLGLKTNNHPVMSPRGRPASQNFSLMWQIFHVTYEGIIWRCR